MKMVSLSIGMLLSIWAEAQSYLPLFQGDKTWSCYGDYFFINVKYKIGPDTLFRGRTWHSVLADGRDVPFSFELDSAEYKSAVYEEGGKVWVIEKGFQAENLLYDFTKVTGDTLQFYRPLGSVVQGVLPNYVTGKVYKTDQVTVFGVTRKRMFIHDPFMIHQLPPQALNQLDSQADIWIEGIGGKTGLFSRMPIWGIVGPKPYLLACVEQDGALIYSNQSGYISYPGDDCFIVPPGSITTIQTNTPTKITVFPNPANELVEVSLPSGTNSFLFLYDQRGRLVFSQQYQSENKPLPINLSSFQRGIYQLVIATEETNTLCRIVHN
jgi:hypothetical protein